MSIIQALAMTVAEIPVFVYTTFGQVQQEKSLFQLVPWALSLEIVCQERRICVSREEAWWWENLSVHLVHM